MHKILKIQVYHAFNFQSIICFALCQEIHNLAQAFVWLKRQKSQLNYSQEL